ncbi:hypothetical protein ISS40_01340 [Candidatus Bathyarchaeota archaeon]|nr:hypothetical protein [Candidatus Bathyarchaeota archaeon]MBL7167293.1 hypothetical protein [Candidatus Bathyarchaeota archaeon]
MIEVNPHAGVKVVVDPIEVISTEKVLVKVQPGCLWTELMQDGRHVGAVIQGPAEYAFDAIAETEEGALGKSFRGDMGGFKIYVGGTDLQGSSRAASHEEFLTRDFSSAEDFIEGVCGALGLHNLHNDSNVSSSGGLGEGVVIWSDDGVKKNVITAKGGSQVLVKDKTVYTLSDESYVMVDDGRVSIRGPGGKRLVIDEGGIIEPEELRNLGPRIAKEVADSLKDLKSTMRRRRREDVPR